VPALRAGCALAGSATVLAAVVGVAACDVAVAEVSGLLGRLAITDFPGIGADERR
jgi:hypothetical protein